jgi:hypothetical protein
MEAQRNRVYVDLAETQKACGLLLAMVEKEEAPEDEETVESIMVLRTQEDITPENIAALYPYAKLSFDCGRYQVAAKTLRSASPPPSPPSPLAQ